MIMFNFIRCVSNKILIFIFYSFLFYERMCVSACMHMCKCVHMSSGCGGEGEEERKS